MLSASRTCLGIIGGAVGALVIGYCIYFDRRRRSDPDYKKKVHQRRQREAEREAEHRRKAGSNGRSSMPDLNDEEAMERYFLQEIKAGELLIGQGQVNEGLDHLACAIAVCSQPVPLVQMLQSTLPPQVFQTLVFKLREMSMGHSDSDGNELSTEPSSGEPSGSFLGIDIE